MAEPAELLPWHEDHWSRFCRQLDRDRVPHGYLICGPAETGKQQLAELMAQKLLCLASPANELPCGQCARCHLIAAGTHPDLYRVTLEDSRQIKVEQVRDLIEWAHQTSQQGGRKVCLVYPADSMNLAAANAFLKSLEEPPADTVLLLVTDQPSRLLPTIRSRCQAIESHLPSRDVALTWLARHWQGEMEPTLLLEIAGGSPLRAVNLVTEEYLSTRDQIARQLLPLTGGETSPLQLASTLAGNDSMLVLELLYQLISDSIGCSMSDGTHIRNTDLADVIQSYANKVSIDHRYHLLDRIARARGALSGTSNANAQMLLEWVLVDSQFMGHHSAGLGSGK